MSKFGTLFPVFVAAAFMAACASGAPDATTLSIAPAAGPGDAPRAATSTVAASDEGASKTEPELDCKKLTGRMQIRILEIRDFNERSQSTGLSRVLQSGVAAVTGGSTAGTDPSGQYATDRSMLDAYNKQLAAKGCKTYDLEAELKPKDFKETPNATIKPAAAVGAVKQK